MTGPPRDRRSPEGAPLRAAFDELSACLEREAGAPRPDNQSVRLCLRECAVSARRLGLKPEWFIIVLKRIFNQRPELQARLEEQLSAPRWNRRDDLISWAIAEYFAAGEKRGRQ